MIKPREARDRVGDEGETGEIERGRKREREKSLSPRTEVISVNSRRPRPLAKIPQVHARLSTYDVYTYTCIRVCLYACVCMRRSSPSAAGAARNGYRLLLIE